LHPKLALPEETVRQNRLFLSGGIVVAVLVVVCLVAVALVVRSRGEENASDEEAQFDTVATPPTGAAAAAAARAIPPPPHPTPQEEAYKGCPAGGDGTDPELNMLKNRIDAPPQPAAIPFESLLNLPWPPGINKKHMASWSAADRAEVAKSNGAGVSTEAFFIRVQSEGAESTNCHAVAPSDVDFHEWIVANQNQDRDKAVVVEVTPRLRAKNSGWTLANFQQLARDKARVRITGWVMLDPEHPDQVGRTRGTIWELHPVTKVEVQRDNQWVDLNSQR
jgi:hypothetical protein